VADAMRGVMPVPVYDLLPGLAIGAVEKVDRGSLGLAGDEFVFLFMFDMCSDFRRKNPLAVVRAFQQAFEPNDRARLVLKISRGDSDPTNLQRLKDAGTDGRIVVVDELVSRAKAYGYIDMCDCVVSLHRSEGLGLLMAEAMLLGKPVIATNYSGNTAFMTPENSLLVDYELVIITEDGAIYKKGSRWAEPSETQAAKYMRQLFENRAEAAALGARARKSAEEQLSAKTAGERMKVRLSVLLSGGGASLWLASLLSRPGCVIF
jgi:glycosyltransferase involved in cell wall biosynthesis